jgi:hypothetical protein
VLGLFAYSTPGEISAVRALFSALVGSEFVVVVRPLLKSNEYPLETAHLPVSLSAVVVVKLTPTPTCSVSWPGDLERLVARVPEHRDVTFQSTPAFSE